ncbi:hypothetical protein ACLIBG_06090 [Virgibacillus sp. W0181]|uniref:hypothetical protein n=1 Tax=Virgibacillus sp. W0181 TaxID=3391581 RepID=UPI003F45D9AF
MKRILVIVFIIILIIIAAGSLIQKETNPSADTRIILEHTYKTYIAPPCFEQSEATNNIADSDLDEARSLDYKADSTCTEEALNGHKEALFVSLLKDIGLLNKKWDTW